MYIVDLHVDLLFTFNLNFFYQQVAWIVFGLYSLMLIVQCVMTGISFGMYMQKKNTGTSINYDKFEDAYSVVQ